jgi:predicted RNA-binding protein with PUA-like domain
MGYWLMKSEPTCYSIEDLRHDKIQPWDGVRNYQVRNMMRDEMKKGDKALFYHSNCPEIGVVGTMTITSEAYPDSTQFDPKSEHPDVKSDPQNPTWLLVEVKFESQFSRTITLSEIKNDPQLSKMALAQKGSRLSVTPVKKEHYERIVKLGIKG